MTTPDELGMLIARGQYMEILAQPVDMTEEERDIVMALSASLAYGFFGEHTTDEMFYQCFLHVKAAVLSGKALESKKE